MKINTLISSSSSPSSTAWLFFIIPGLIYTLDKIITHRTRYMELDILETELLPSDVIRIRFGLNFFIFSWEPALWTLMSGDRVMLWLLSKKNIAIFGYKQWVLSIDMKTKIAQQVEREWMREWESVRVREGESERVWKWESDFWA